MRSASRSLNVELMKTRNVLGKLQINELLADARRSEGDAFSLLRFNDFVWNNGNVPIALQRWELLHDPSEVPAKMDEPAKTMGKP